jgi:hypothetical protein
MIEFSSTILSIMANPNIETFYLVRIGSDYKTTTHFDNVTLSNGHTYLSDGRVLNVDDPRLSAIVDREIYKVTLADPDFELSTLAENSLIGSVFEVRIGFVNPATGLPVTTVGDTMLAYKGIVESAGYIMETGNRGEVTLQISGASPMADLDAVRAFYGSRDFIKGLDPTDTAFDQVYEGSGSVNIKWGKG